MALCVDCTGGVCGRAGWGGAGLASPGSAGTWALGCNDVVGTDPVGGGGMKPPWPPRFCLFPVLDCWHGKPQDESATCVECAPHPDDAKRPD